MDRSPDSGRECKLLWQLIGPVMLYLKRLGAAFVLGLFSQSAVAQVACLPIDRISVTGTAIISASEIAAAVAPYEGQCLGIEGINAALEAVTFSYVDRGYIASRAYLPEQDISDRVLDIAVVEGTLSSIYFNGNIRPIWQAIAFPGMIGEPANLREIEQGLDIIRGMPAYDATMEIRAGEGEGDSILEVSADADKRWSARVEANNHGTAGSGEYQGVVDLGYDHLLGLNESWSLSYSRGTEEYPFSGETGGAMTTSYTGRVIFPYGPWKLEAEYKFSGYETDTLGPITTIGTDGWTHTGTVSLSRLLLRGQDTKTTIEATLEWRQNVNRIAGITIESSSRTLSSARIDLRHERVILGGSLTARIGVEQGLALFGAEIADEQPAGSPDAQFLLVDFGLDYYRAWQGDIGSISYSGSLSGQWSDDLLYGNYNLTLAGLSSVRGAKTLTFDPADSALFTGNTGIVWRNELVWAPPLTLPSVMGQMQLYGALDAGSMYAESAGFGAPLLGSAIGVRTSGGNIVFDIAYQQILRMPNGAEPPEGIWLVSVSAKY